MHSFFPRERRSSLLGLRLGLTGYRENVERDPREETIERFREYEMPCVTRWWVRVSFSFFDFRLHASDACMDFLESALSHGASCGVPGHNCVSSRGLGDVVSPSASREDAETPFGWRRRHAPCVSRTSTQRRAETTHAALEREPKHLDVFQPAGKNAGEPYMHQLSADGHSGIS
uniref:Uncharacterized protein n=1 Tax=Toxoplasma gondii COUG TaxID=1074873 RepID=A0A2G8YEM3_TOXGO|nr:hypothetical protein TGCOUG_262500 [Toxoplasma gondii COUG]